jgi:UDP-N-acetylglucosamine--N-acetylmuramyl-(pentapeptide) pyrophosphoryl-undecaprenol N-acetylglucosamine transferase
MTAANTFDLDGHNKTLFVFGGSQGSEALNQCVAGMIGHFDTISVLWQTGKHNIEKYKQYASKTVRVLPFIDDMKSAYALSDLVFSRSGALTIAELTACGLPSILVPFPSAAADHQTHNARSLADAGAAEMVPESELDTDIMSGKISTLIHNENALNEMAVKSKRLGKPDAAKVIVNKILEQVRA